MQYPGRNLFINYINSTTYEIISQATSFGAGLGKHDVEIVLPYYITMEKIYIALYEILAVGGCYPNSGIMNVFSEDPDIKDEMIRCGRDISAYLNINICFHTEVIKGLSTSFVISLFSNFNKNKLKVNMGQDGHRIYFLRCDDDEIDAMNLEYFVPLKTFRNLIDTTGIDEIYILKNESIKKGVQRLIENTNCFFVKNRENKISHLTKIKEGRGFLLLTPYKIKQKQLNNLTFYDLGCLIKK